MGQRERAVRAVEEFVLSQEREGQLSLEHGKWRASQRSESPWGAPAICHRGNKHLHGTDCGSRKWLILSGALLPNHGIG